MVRRGHAILRGLSLGLLIVIVLGQSITTQNAKTNTAMPYSIPNAPNATPLNLNVTLHGVGASFPAPLIVNWTKEYHRSYPNTTISYSPLGSGAGRSALFNKTSDFAASDAPLSPAQRYLAPNALHIPETIGSVVLAYNLPTIPAKGLNLTGDIVAKIYLGQITKWNDSAIQNINPGLKSLLPFHDIITVHRFDGSGTTFVFTSWLTLESPGAWATGVTPSFGTSIIWPGSPTGLPSPPIYLTGNQNSGVADAIRNNQYSIGYVELSYVLDPAHPLAYSFIKSSIVGTNFVEPSPTTTGFAVTNSSTVIPSSGAADWSKVSLLNAPGTQTYPIATFTYFLVYQELNVVPSYDYNETAQANALISFLRWAVHQGQIDAPGNFYVALPSNVVAIDDASINSIRFTIKSHPVHRTFHLTASSSGWNFTSANPNPTFSVYSNDTITILLSTTDATPHQFYIDSDNNNVLDNNETSSASDPFTSSTPTNLTFAPRAFNPASLPGSGTFKYRDSSNPSVALGSFSVSTQQRAGIYLSAGSLSASSLPVMDTSKVSLIGSQVVDLRTSLVSGNITVVAVDKTSGTVTQSKSYLVSNLPLGQQFVLNIAVSPNDLGPITSASLTPSFSLRREIDINGDGRVNIIELSAVGSAFGTSSGSPLYKAVADFNADGFVNIIDLSTVGSFFNAALIFR